MNKLKLPAALLALGLSLYTAALAAPADWPQWRGPNRNGIVTEPAARQWPEDGPKKIWSVPLDIGYASPVAHAGKLYVFYTDENTKQDVLACLNPADGQPVWK